MSAVTVARPRMIVPAGADQIPTPLLERDQWVCWEFQARDSKWTKVPRRTNGKAAKANDPSTWTSFADVLDAAKRNPNLGVGFVFGADDPFIGIDLDGCLMPDGELKPWATPILERFADTYAEVSPSGHGIKLWAQGSLAGLITGTGTRRPCGDGQVEIYDRGRFFTVTGKRFATSALGVAEHQSDTRWLLAHIGATGATCAATAAIPAAVAVEPLPAPEPSREFTGDEQAALRAKLEAARANVPKFADLWLGGACGYYTAGMPDPSRADMAFCNFVAYHLGLDATGVDQAFRMSERMRPKWNQRHYGDGRTYGQGTIQEAMRWAAQERQRSAMGKAVTIPAANPDASIADLNAMPIFAGVGLAWDRFEMSGDLIFGYCTGVRVKWENTTELLSFAKSQAIILKYLHTLIPSPPRAKTKAIWEPAAGMMVRLATVINSGDEMQVELADLLPLCFRRAGSPVARSDADVFRFMVQVRDWRRDPYTADAVEGGAVPAPFVFVYDGSVFLNAHKLRMWASLPRVTATMIRKAEMTRELASMGFKYQRCVQRVLDGQRATMDMWRGPLSALGDSLEQNDIPGVEAR